MKNVIVGTSGHIDHGKTWLIKALTGIDADRLKEEKQRGITIELGFADMPNDRKMDIGIIDVPGHEKFVRHMLAGIGGIDIVLLVVAADEGVMPQTREHFEILKMLEIDRGIIVVTKKDLVDQEWLGLVEEDIKEYVKGSFMENAPLIAVSSETGENIQQLKEMILDMAQDSGERRTDSSLLRLPADRVFTIGGFGTVITGTLMEGAVHLGDDIMIYPSRKTAKVRNIQVHGENVETAFAGQRTAVNLTGIKKEEISRGNVIAAPGLLECTRLLDVRIDMFDETRRIINNGSRVHFYCGAEETICKVVLLEEDNLTQGQSGFAQLRFEEEIAVKRNDRFIIRFFSPMETIGGGTVLNAAPEKHKRFDVKATAMMKKQSEGDEKTALEQLFLAESKRIPSYRDVLRLFGSTEKEAGQIMWELKDENVLIEVGKDILLHKDYVNSVNKMVKGILSSYHAENPIRPGMPKEEFRSKLGNGLKVKDGKKADILAIFQTEHGVAEEKDGVIALKGFEVCFDEAQQELADRILSDYLAAGVEVPEKEEYASRSRNGKQVLEMIDALAGSGRLVRLNHQFYLHPQIMEKAMGELRKKLDIDGKITLAEYRTIINSSRKYAMMILEYTDEQKITRMNGDAREYH